MTLFKYLDSSRSNIGGYYKKINPYNLEPPRDIETVFKVKLYLNLKHNMSYIWYKNRKIVKSIYNRFLKIYI